MESLKILWKTATADWLAGLRRRVCDDPGCHRWLTVGSLKSRSVGVQMGTSWFCGYSCFHRAAQQQLEASVNSNSRRLDSKPRMTLGLELIARGAIHPEELRKANQIQAEENIDLGGILTRESFATEAQVTAARASLWGCPMYSPPATRKNTGVHIPSVLLASCEAIPLHFGAATNQLLVGFVRAVDYEFLYAVEAVTGCKTQACFIKPSDYRIHQTVASDDEGDAALDYASILFDGTRTANERARILCSYGAELHANSVVIIRSGSYLWARLTGKRLSRDLLFKVISARAPSSATHSGMAVKVL